MNKRYIIDTPDHYDNQYTFITEIDFHEVSHIRFNTIKELMDYVQTSLIQDEMK